MVGEAKAVSSALAPIIALVMENVTLHLVSVPVVLDGEVQHANKSNVLGRESATVMGPAWKKLQHANASRILWVMLVKISNARMGGSVATMASATSKQVSASVMLDLKAANAARRNVQVRLQNGDALETAIVIM